MEKKFKNFLAVAACVTLVYNTVSPAMGANIIIDSVTSAVAEGSSSTVKIGSDTFNWDRSNVTSDKMTLSGGEIIVNGYSQDTINGALTATTGDIYIDSGTLTIASGSSVAQAVNTQIYGSSELSIIGGTVAIDSADNWAGNISISRGSLTISDNIKTGTFTQTGGTTTITGSNFVLNNTSDSITDGNLNVGSGVSTGYLRVQGGNIGGNTIVNVGSGSELRVSEGDVSFDDNDTVNGSVYVNGGTFNGRDFTKTTDSTFSQNNGTVNITGQNFTMNNASDSFTGGNLNIGDGSEGTSFNVNKGKIEDNSTVNLNEKSSLNVNGGNVTLNNDDTWSGDLNLSGGSLALVGMTKNTSGMLNQTAGTTTVIGSGFDLNNASDTISGGTVNIGSGDNIGVMSVSKGAITSGTALNINENSTLNVNGGSVSQGANGNWAGTINVSSGTLDIHSSKSTTGTLNQTGGTTTVYGNNFDLNNVSDNLSGGTLNVGDGTNIANLHVSYGTIGSGSNVVLHDNNIISVEGGNVTLDNSDTWRGTVNVTNGTLNISDANKNVNGKLTQTGGTTNITGTNFDLNNASDNISGGTLNIGTANGKAGTSATLNVSKGVVNTGANINLNSNSTINVSDTGFVAIDSSDNWAGNVNVKGGDLTLAGVTNKTGSLTQTDGSTYITGTGTKLNNSSDNISGGNLFIGTNTTGSDLTVTNGKINEGANVVIHNNSTLKVDGGTVALDNSDTWNGEVNVQSGNLNLKNAEKNSNGKLIQTGGSTTVTGTGFDLNNTSDSISGGNLTVGDGSTESTIDISKGSIKSGATVKLNSNSKLNVKGGDVTLNTGDTWNGDVNVSGGSLALVGITKNTAGTLTQTAGTTTVTGNNFVLNNSYDRITGGTFNVGDGIDSSVVGVSNGLIDTDAILNVKSGATLNVGGGTVNLDSSTDSWQGNIALSGGRLNLNTMSKSNDGIYTQTGGVATVTGNGFDLNNRNDSINSGSLNIGDGDTVSNINISEGTIASGANILINNKGTMNVTGGNATIDNNDTWLGNVNVTNGNLTIANANKNTNGVFTQSGGTTTITGTNFDLNNASDNISGGKLNIGTSGGKTTTSAEVEISQGVIEQNAEVNLLSSSAINISGGTLFLDSPDTWAGNVNVKGGSLALIGVTDKTGVLNQTSGSTTVMGTGFDLNNSSDNISGGNLYVGTESSSGDITVTKGNIKSVANVIIGEGSDVNIDGGTVTLDNSDTWNGNVNMTSGTLNIDNASKSNSGKYSQSGGTTTVTGSNFVLNNTSDNVSGGTFNVGDGTSEASVGIANGYINPDAVVNIKNNATMNITGGNVGLGSNDDWTGRVNINSGNLALVGINKKTSAIYNQSGGTTTVTGSNFDLNNTLDTVSGGTFNIGDGIEDSTVAVSKGVIEQEAVTNIESGSTLNVTGGTVNIDGATDKWIGNVNVSRGNLNIDSMIKDMDAVLTQTGGTTTITGSGTTLNNDNDKISSGYLKIGTDSSQGELNVESGTITQDANVTIANASTLAVKGGTVTLDGNNDTPTGHIIVSSGTLNLNDGFEKATTTGGNFNQSDGTTNIDASKLDLNRSGSKITGGHVNITNGGELIVNNSTANKSELNVTNSKLTIGNSTTYTTTGGTVNSASEVNINSGGTLELNSPEAVVVIDGNNDNFDGHAKLTKGTLDLHDGVSKTTTTNGTYNQTDGTLNITDSSKLTLNESNSKISGGSVNIDSSTLEVKNGQDNTSSLSSTGGKFWLGRKSTYKTTDGTIDSATVVDIDSGSTLAIAGDNAEVTLNSTNDSWNGNIKLSKGKLNLTDNFSKNTTETGSYVQTGGNLAVNSASLTLNDANSNISAGNVNLSNNSTLTVKGDSSITGGNIVIDDTSVLNYLAQKGLIQLSGDNEININTSGLIDMVNNVRTSNSINTLTINNSTGDGQANFAIDILARNSNGKPEADTITANTIKVATQGDNGTVYLSDWNLNGDIFGKNAPHKRHINLGKIFNSNNIGSDVQFAATDKEVLTPLGYYKLNASSSNDGSYTLDLTRFNPQAYRGQVATLSTYMNQLVVNDTLFNRAQIRRYGMSYDQWFRNKTAIVEGNASYERTIKDGGVWTEMFGNFETLKMTQGLDKVRNNSWGFIVGGDFGLKELKKGWSFIPTAYLAYNGGHQTFNSVGMWENGGQIGFMGSWMKKNFIETALAYGGIYGTDMSVADNSDRTFNYFFGLASKTAYDLNLGSHFKIQPSVTLAYNFFGKQSWTSDYGDLAMSAGFLNGFNVAPGVNFIYQRETWNTYATISYAWNLLSKMEGSAGGIDLPSLRMKSGYIQYGFGVTKTFSDRFMMYAQASMRNIGRTGIICQGGMNWRW